MRCLAEELFDITRDDRNGAHRVVAEDPELHRLSCPPAPQLLVELAPIRALLPIDRQDHIPGLELIAIFLVR